jgi:hypothetical protein
MAGVLYIHGVVLTGAGGAPVPRLLGEGRSEPPSQLDAMWNSSAGSSIIACRSDGVLLQVEPMKVTPESLLLAVEVVSDELKASQMNGFTEGEAITHDTCTISGDGERR